MRRIADRRSSVRRHWQHRRSDDRGVSALELAVLAPSLIFLIFFVMQVALYLYGRSVALQSAREGVTELRLAQTPQAYSVIHDNTISDVRQFAHNVGSGMLLDPQPVSRYDTAAGSVTVTVTGQSISLVPFVKLSITEHATGAIERFQQTPVTPRDSG